MLGGCNEEDVDHRREGAARHPHTKVVHVSHEHLTAQRLAEEGSDGHGGALDPSAAVEKREGRAGKAGSERVGKPIVQSGDARDLVELFRDVLDPHGLTLQRGDVVVDAVDLVRVDAHESLLGQLGAERPVSVRGGDNLRVRHLGAVLGDTDGPGDVRHRFLHTVGAGSKRQEHLSEAKNDLRLMSKAIVGRHAVGEDLVAAIVALMRPSREYRIDHGYSIPRATRKVSDVGPRVCCVCGCV